MVLISTRRLIALALVLAGTASTAQAQEVASTIEQLRVLVRPGSEVRVTVASGRQVKGTIQGFDSTALRLRVHGVDEVLQEPEIRTIRERRDDSLVNGARNGFIVGAALGTWAAFSLAGEDVGWTAVFIPFSIAIYGGMGAGIGVGIDALIRTDDVLFDSAWKASRATVAPIVDRGRKGVRVTLARW